jgi:hypothetical protein
MILVRFRPRSGGNFKNHFYVDLKYSWVGAVDFAAFVLVAGPLELPEVFWRGGLLPAMVSFTYKLLVPSCYAIVLRGRKSVFRAGFWPDCYRESTEIGLAGPDAYCVK